MLRLEDYDISPSTGFLPSTPPLECLPDPYYEPWETLISMLHNLMLAGRLREYVKQKLPILTTDHLQTPEEYRRAFLILSFIAHGYVWGKYEPVLERLPANIAIPWVEVSKYLDVAPIINHAAVVTWNWSLIFPDEPFDLSNLATLITFTNTSDESWFYLVTTAIERFGGRILTSIMAAIQATNDGNNKILINELRNISSILFDINKTLQKMFKKCDPYVFYWKVRPFLSGWENEDRLPQGLIYEGVDGNDENGNPIYRRYIGGSAGQSALIQSLDIALSVKHYPTGIKQHTNSSRHRCSNDYPQPHDTYQYITNGHIEPQQPYLHRIRQNIPGPHRRFLEDLSKSANIRNYILSTTNCDSSVNTSSSSSSSSSDESEDMCLLRGPSEANDLIKAYNECLDQMRDFRKTHLNIVKFYIIKQARRGGDSHFNAKEVVPPVDKDLVGNNEITAVNSEIITTTTKSIEIIKGTGGTNLMPFLEQMRDETLENNETTAVNNEVIATTTTKSIEVIKGTGGTNLIPFLEQIRDETTAQKIE